MNGTRYWGCLIAASGWLVFCVGFGWFIGEAREEIAHVNISLGISR